MESEPVLTPKEKSPLPEVQRRVEPEVLYHAGQRAQHANNWAIAVPEQHRQNHVSVRPYGGGSEHLDLLYHASKQFSLKTLCISVTIVNKAKMYKQNRIADSLWEKN